MKTLKKLFYLLTPHERKQAVLLSMMILIMAFLEMIGVASIMPFIAVLTNPNLVEANIFLNTLFKFSSIFGVENKQEFLFFLGILVFILLIITLSFKALTIYAQTRFVQMREYSIAKYLIEGYLHQPYSWFLNRNSADFGKSILSEVSAVVTGGMAPMMELISKGTITIAILLLLTFADPKLTLIIGFTLSLVYVFIYLLTRSFLNRIGNERYKANQLRFLAVNEAFGASKEVKFGGLEENYIKRFSEPAKIFAKHQSSLQILNQLPRFALEAVAFGGMLLAILYLMLKTGTFNNALPIIAVYAFAGYRLIPALQQIYVSVNQLRYLGPAIDGIYYDLKNLETFNNNYDRGIIKLNKSIALKNIYFEYPNSSRTALKNINLNIPARSTVGIVGATGSGKTTTVDVILGLLESQRGTLEVDSQVITHHNSRAWQKSIGYVPQHIYLADDTIAANIAFGKEQKDINLKLVEKASKIANLHDFVLNELPKQYQTTVGERGIRLSGGQRQRIGIARALYHNPQVLILDEATSSLDNSTEKAVMESINKLGKHLTIILIAHRLNTVKKCDIIFLFEKGKLINQGSFSEIIEKKENPDLK